MTDKEISFILKSLSPLAFKEDRGFDGKQCLRGYLHQSEDLIIYIGKSDDSLFSTLQGRIAVDNHKAFNKWTQVPFSVSVKDACANIPGLMAAINYIQSKEGFNASNQFEEVEFHFGFSRK